MGSVRGVEAPSAAFVDRLAVARSLLVFGRPSVDSISEIERHRTRHFCAKTNIGGSTVTEKT